MKNVDMLRLARALGAVIIDKSDIIEKIGKNLRIKSSVFDDYWFDTYITVYVMGTRTLNKYKPVLCDGVSYTLLFIEKQKYEYIPWEDGNFSC